MRRFDIPNVVHDPSPYCTTEDRLTAVRFQLVRAHPCYRDSFERGKLYSYSCHSTVDQVCHPKRVAQTCIMLPILSYGNFCFGATGELKQSPSNFPSSAAFTDHSTDVQGKNVGTSL
jgi:hypothetical protein